MLKNTIEITLIASEKDGILPNLMGKLDSLGLMFRRSDTKRFDDGFKLTLICSGDIDFDKTFLVKSLKEVPNVSSVINVIDMDGDVDQFSVAEKDKDDEITELHPLKAQDAITQDVLQIVEDRLADVYGPVANLLLKSALKKSTCVGDLFTILSDDINDEQKTFFLRNITGLDHLLPDKA